MSSRTITLLDALIIAVMGILIGCDIQVITHPDPYTNNMVIAALLTVLPALMCIIGLTNNLVKRT